MVDIEADLRREFPKLYHEPVQCGAYVPPGWVTLVHELSDELDEIVADIPKAERPVVEQIKEKFGGLRFYLSHLNDAMDEAIGRAEDRSFKTCQDCGLPGVSRKIDWLIATLCNRCATSR